MKYIPSYTCIYFDILLTSDLSEVSGFQMRLQVSRTAAAAQAAIWNLCTSDKSDVKSISKYIQVYNGIYVIY